ncbi:MAG TPA: polyprenyl synthetase family protein [Desulfobacteraceae bacterium]|nr:polyprenyl synthetase family protein [Desulfobacteraceae bacterium]
MEIKTYLNEQKEIVEEALSRYMLRVGGEFADHIDTLRYSLFAGGKRIRPILCLAGARLISGAADDDEAVLPIACALECLHTYSLIHDDLPAMDDDALRRGKPTNHVVYGEAAAILAGDALQCFAFDLLSNPDHIKIAPQAMLEIISVVSRAAGPLGMVGGQYLDVVHEGRENSYDLLRTIHRSKTGKLITASVLAGGIAGGADERQKKNLTDFGNAIGLAFQIVDDILNVESTTEALGKAAGSDRARGKATYPAFFGLEQSKKMAADAADSAVRSLNGFGDDAAPLRALAQYIITRTK